MPPIYVVDLLVQGHAGQLSGLDRTAMPIVEHRDIGSSVRIENLIDYIDLIANSASEATRFVSIEPESSQIVRLTTDEFSFYPDGAPFSIEEYKDIIKGTAEIANKLSPDCHLILSSFPVAWPDGGIHNCGLYVESPKKPDTKATLHHFSKKNHADKDFQYKKADGTRYRLTTDEDCSEAQLPNNVLNDTEIATNDVNHSPYARPLFHN